MNPKIKLAVCSGAACGGCDSAVLDLHAGILELAAATDIVFWPAALDFGEAEVAKIPDGTIDLCLFSGAVSNSDHVATARRMRTKSRLLVAFGACAHLGGIVGLANLHGREEILDGVYKSAGPTRAATVPSAVTEVAEGVLTLPTVYDVVRTLGQVVEVDYFIPGCPPEPWQVGALVEAVLDGHLPPRGSVFGASELTQCEECARARLGAPIREIKRIATAQPDPEPCLLEHGFACSGPATRGGCHSSCLRAGVACRGCLGPPRNVVDQGAKALSAFASILDAETEAEAGRFAARIPDPLRTFNRFGIPASLLGRRTWRTWS